MNVISRRVAADSGRTFFFTGKPCKHGHMSQRYVTNGACRACLIGNFKPKRNPWTTLLVPYTNANLWYLADMPREQRVALRVYLQHCIFAFVRQNYKGDRGVELETAMSEIENRGRFAADNPNTTD